MHVLVTGGAGFIGSHMVDALIARGDTVTVLDDLSTGKKEHLNATATFVQGDVADVALVGALVNSVDAVVHLAAVASVQVCEREPERAYRTNVMGTENIFQAASGKRVPVVYASSAAVYGDNQHLPLSESLEERPLGNYGKHKLANEETAACGACRVPSVGLRFFNVYGPRQDPRSPYSGVISIFAANAKAGEPLTFFGDGEQTRDFIYVGDVVTLVLKALTMPEGAQVMNGCTGVATSLKQLSAAIGVAAGRDITTRHEDARAGDIRHSLGDPSRAKAALGFEATTALDAGLKQLLAHD